MSDYSEGGAVPVEDAVIEDPPTVDEVMEAQRRDYPEQAATSPAGAAPGDEVDSPGDPGDEAAATVEAGGTPTGDSADGAQQIEGPNSA